MTTTPAPPGFSARAAKAANSVPSAAFRTRSSESTAAPAIAGIGGNASWGTHTGQHLGQFSGRILAGMLELGWSPRPGKAEARQGLPSPKPGRGAGGEGYSCDSPPTCTPPFSYRYS